MEELQDIIQYQTTTMDKMKSKMESDKQALERKHEEKLLQMKVSILLLTVMFIIPSTYVSFTIGKHACKHSCNFTQVWEISFKFCHDVVAFAYEPNHLRLVL